MKLCRCMNLMTSSKNKDRLALKFFLILVSIFILGCSSPTIKASEKSDLSIIRKNIFTDILSVVPSDQRATWLVPEVRDWKKLLNNDGSYSDLNYLDMQSAVWGPHLTLARAQTLLMATAMPTGPFYRNAEVIDMALKSIRFVAEGFWWNYNWWTLEIGVPLIAYRTLVLIDENEEIALDDISRRYLMNAARQGHITDHPSRWLANGQNLIWFAEITIGLGVLFDRPDWVTTAVDAISMQLEVGHPQGIQVDDTFHQHGKLLYSGGYGLNFSNDSARMFRLLSDTSLSFSPVNYQTLSRYILDGQLWLIHGKILDYSSMGRTYARINAGDSATLLPACSLLAQTEGSRQQEFIECEKLLRAGVHNGRNGNRHFWKSDLSVHNRPGFGISVRSYSTRTLNGDTSPNGEGLKSHHLADGVTHIYRSGEEYFNIHPIWDFKRVPGVTAEHIIPYPSVPNANYIPNYGPTSFVGGVSDGEYGASTMDFSRDRLSGKKSWFFFDKGMIALGAGIECRGCLPVLTSINQEWSKDSIKYGSKKLGLEKVLESGSLIFKDLSWAHSNQVGYIFLSDEKVVIQNTIQTGSWKSLGIQLSDAPLSGKVTSLWIMHSNNLINDQYAYAVLPNLTALETQAMAKQPTFKILSNTQEIQALEFEQKIIQATFFKPGKLSWNNGKSWISVDRPVIIQLRNKNNSLELSAASPSQDVEYVRIGCSLNLDGCRGNFYEIEFPKGQMAGKSVVRSLH